MICVFPSRAWLKLIFIQREAGPQMLLHSKSACLWTLFSHTAGQFKPAYEPSHAFKLDTNCLRWMTTLVDHHFWKAVRFWMVTFKNTKVQMALLVCSEFKAVDLTENQHHAFACISWDSSKIGFIDWLTALNCPWLWLCACVCDCVGLRQTGNHVQGVAQL